VSLVAFHLDGAVGVVKLNRPERHNSLVPELLEGLLEAHRDVVAGGVSVILLAAAGRTFSTGGDVVGILGAGDRLAYSKRLVGLLNEVILAFAGGPVPVVGAVHGMVTGGSLGLVLMCDHVVLAAEATIRPWYSIVGFAPDGGWTALLPGVIGARRARSILLTDATITAADALDWGLADEVVPAGRVGERAMEAARKIAAGAPATRAAIRRLTRADLVEAAARLEAEREAFLAQVTTREATEGMNRFLRGELR